MILKRKNEEKRIRNHIDLKIDPVRLEESVESGVIKDKQILQKIMKHNIIEAENKQVLERVLKKMEI